MLRLRSFANRRRVSSSDDGGLAPLQDAAQTKRERRFRPLSFELIALTEPLLGTACVLPQPILTSGEKSSRKSGSNNYAARLLPSAYVNNLIWG